MRACPPSIPAALRFSLKSKDSCTGSGMLNSSDLAWAMEAGILVSPARQLRIVRLVTSDNSASCSNEYPEALHISLKNLLGSLNAILVSIKLVYQQVRQISTFC